MQVIDEHTLKLEQAAVTVAPVFKQMQATPNAGSKANGSSDQNIDMDNVNLNDSGSPQKTTDVVRGRQFGKIFKYYIVLYQVVKNIWHLHYI